VPVSAPGPDELLIEPRACGLNRADIGLYRQSGSLPGRELAGEVTGVGDNVSGWAAGDRVMALGPGLAPEPVAVPARLAIPVPASLSWAEAGALPVALLTMHDALVTRGRLAPGGRVLIHAATSGVGVAGVQLAGLLGASVVFGTSRSAAKLEVLRQHVGAIGCELVGIDTTHTAFETVASQVDLVVDNVGASVAGGNVTCTAIGGRIVQVGRLGGRRAQLDLEEVARKRLELIGVTFRTRTPDEVAEIVERVVTDVGSRLDSIRPRIERTYPLDQWQAALEDLGRDTHVGKLVVVR